MFPLVNLDISILHLILTLKRNILYSGRLLNASLVKNKNLAKAVVSFCLKCMASTVGFGIILQE